MPRKRTELAIAAAALVLGASVGLYAASGDDPAPANADSPQVVPQFVPAVRPAVAAPMQALRVDLLSRAVQSGPGRDVFTAHAWQAPPPAAAPVAVAPPPPPPPPGAPALPFNFMGRLESPGAKTIYYLAEGDTLHAVSAGDTINGTHRIEGVSGNRMDILYLPLAERQTLALGNEP